MRVMNSRMHWLVDEFLGRIAQHPSPRSIHEGHRSIPAETTDSFIHGCQNQPGPLLYGRQRFGLLPSLLQKFLGFDVGG